MPTNDTTTSDTTNQTTGHTRESGGSAGTTGAETAQAAGSVTELPEWAQQEITRARTEAAKYRRERNALQKSVQDNDSTATDAESRAEIDRLAGELDAAQRDAARLRAALAADIPPTQVAEFAARLVGDTDEELTADAQRLRELLGLGERKRPDPSQGAGRDSSTSDETPADAFAAFISERLA